MTAEVSGYNPDYARVRAGEIQSAIGVTRRRRKELPPSITLDQVMGFRGVVDVFTFTQSRARFIGETLDNLKRVIGKDVRKRDVFDEVSGQIIQQVKADQWFRLTAEYLQEQERDEEIPQLIKNALADTNPSTEKTSFTLGGEGSVKFMQLVGNIVRILYLASAELPLSVEELLIFDHPEIVHYFFGETEVKKMVINTIPVRLNAFRSSYEIASDPKGERYYLKVKDGLAGNISQDTRPEEETEDKKPHISIVVQVNDIGIPVAIQLGNRFLPLQQYKQPYEGPLPKVEDALIGEEFHLPEQPKRPLLRVEDALILLRYFEKKKDDRLVPIGELRPLFTDGSRDTTLSTRIQIAASWIINTLKVDQGALLRIIQTGSGNYYGLNGIGFDVKKTTTPLPNAEK